MHKLIEEIKRGVKGVILGTIAFGLALGVTFCVLYGIGYVGNKLETTIGVQYENAKRERFEKNIDILICDNIIKKIGKNIQTDENTKTIDEKYCSYFKRN